jgi:hypothetical protein
MLAPNWNNEIYLKFLHLAVQKNDIEYITRSLMRYTACIMKDKEFRRQSSLFL